MQTPAMIRIAALAQAVRPTIMHVETYDDTDVIQTYHGPIMQCIGRNRYSIPIWEIMGEKEEVKALVEEIRNYEFYSKYRRYTPTKGNTL